MRFRFPPWIPRLAGRRSLPQRRSLQRVDPVSRAPAPPPMDAFDRAIAAILRRNPEMTLWQLIAYLQAANAQLRNELADLDRRLAEARKINPFRP